MKNEENSQEESDSKHSIHKSHQIRKSPKPAKRPAEPAPLERKDTIVSNLRITSQFGVFESEMQKQSRLEKFWSV